MNAVQARKLSYEANNEIPDLALCFVRIEECAKKGRNKAVFNCVIDYRAIEKLKELGYTTHIDEYGDLRITW